MNRRLFDVMMGILIATVMVGAQLITHDDPPRTLALENDCIPADQGQIAITSITPEGKIFCEKHAVLGYGETGIPELACPVPADAGCGLEQREGM